EMDRGHQRNAVHALQAGHRSRIATPADWRPGGEVIIPPSIADEKARTLFPQGWTTIKSYPRITRIPETQR
ncbi:MAG: hypothetical protein AAFY59_12320, partial [Pseudomonadota bacterium]